MNIPAGKDVTTPLRSDEEFVHKVEEFRNGFIASGVLGLVASGHTRQAAIEKLRVLTIMQIDGPEHKSGIVNYTPRKEQP